MGSLGNPKTWVPYMNTKDCSQGFCSLYCPQWCYIIFPPPPPFEFPNNNSTPNFSPLVIAIIGILASAFLLVSYYAIISKFCANMDSSRRDQNHNPSVELEENRDPSNHEPWHGTTNGLDEAIIKSITIHKFKKGDGFVQGTDCPVCLSEFEDDESLRLLPKCTHLFHVKCIDTWLRSHSNCPLCRASVGFVNALETNIERNDSFAALEAMETRGEGEISQNNVVGSSVEGDSIIEIRDEEEEENRGIRRSVSMGYLSQTRVSIMDMLRIDQDGDFHLDEGGSSKRPRIEMSQCSSHRSRVLHCVMSPVSMKRSFSSGRFSFARRGRGGRTVIPL